VDVAPPALRLSVPLTRSITAPPGTGEWSFSASADGALDRPAYPLDAATPGVPRGWIRLGHVASEGPGTLEMARWMRGFVPEVPVRFARAEAPFRVPK
jgi:hypothetical protein